MGLGICGSEDTPVLTDRQIEDRITVNMIKMGADNSRFFQPNAVVADEIRHATRWIDLVVWAVRKASMRLNDLDSALQSFLDDDDSRHAGVGRSWSNVKFHNAWTSAYFVPTPTSHSPGASKPFGPSNWFSCCSISLHASTRSASPSLVRSVCRRGKEPFIASIASTVEGKCHCTATVCSYPPPPRNSDEQLPGWIQWT